MTLKPSNWLVRWAYVCETPPSRTTLCALAWRVVALTPLKIGVPLFLAGGYAYLLYAFPWDTLRATGAFVGGGGLISTVMMLVVRFEDTFLYTAYRAIKDRYCPLVWIND